MNPQHVRAFVWLRYRLRVNQLKRGGVLNTIIVAILAGAAVLGTIGSFVGGLLVGLLALPGAPPVAHLLTWDGIVAALIMSWMIGLLTDIQRTDGLTPDKFLHLPVSPVGAFLVNYFSSYFSLTMILFVSAMIGLVLGQAFAGEPRMLLALPLLAAALLALTAVTYQFQGWLATLMTNPRRRRTVIVVVTASFILFFQLPNLVNILRPWQGEETTDPSTRYTEKLKELDASFKAGRMPVDEFQRQTAAANQEYQVELKDSGRRTWEGVERTARVLNTALPPGWLALGAADLAGGAVLPALLGGLGLTVIGSFSLWRAYRTTLRLFTGHDRHGGGTTATPAEAGPPGPEKVRLIEWQLPGVSEPAAAVAVAAARSLMRAPEAKMVLIVPVILVVVFGSIFLSLKVGPPAAVRPLFAFGAISFVLLSAVQLIGNQFGYDRGGFRVYVLGPVPRRDILLGKNLAAAPFVLGLIAVSLIGLECVCPMRVDHFLAAFAQAAAMYLLFCLLANAASVAAPMPVASGAMKSSQVKLTPVLAQFALLAAFPVVCAPLLIPLGIEVLLAEVTGADVIPVALPLTLVLLVGVVWVYRRGLEHLGRFLADREQAILEVVTSKSE